MAPCTFVSDFGLSLSRTGHGTSFLRPVFKNQSILISEFGHETF